MHEAVAAAASTSKGSGAPKVPTTLPLSRFVTAREWRLSAKLPTRLWFVLMITEHGVLLPMQELTGVLATHWKLLPTSGVAVTRVGAVGVKGRRNEAEHPVHGTGGLPGTR